jgi:tetratricopeptide (TPR) repeat protein
LAAWRGDSASASDVVEREAELATARSLLEDAATGRGHVMLVEGPAGIGKSRLLREVAARAEQAGVTVGRARAGEAEEAFPFGVVRRLFEPVLAVAPAEAREALLRAVASPPGHASLHGIYLLAADLAASTPLLLAVDDAHRADAASLRALAFLARRIEALPVLLVLTLSQRHPGAEPGVLDELRGEPLATVVRPAVLSAGAAAGIVREVLGRDTARAVCDECTAATGGNPRLLRELVEDLAAEGATAMAYAAPGVPALAAGRLPGAILRRVSRLGDDAAALVRAVAVLGDGVERRTAAALAGLDDERAAEAAAALIRGELLDEGVRLGFRYPVVRGAVYCAVDFVDRPAWHGRAAGMLRAEGAPPDRVAEHLVRAGGLDAPWVAEVLRDAAVRARRRGDLEDAAGLLARALAATPGDEARPDRLLELGVFEVHTLRDAGFDRLRRASELVDDAGRRAVVELALGRALAVLGEAGDATGALGRALADAGEAGDAALCARAEAELVAAGLAQPSMAKVAVDRLARVVSEAGGDETRDPALLALMAAEGAAAGRSCVDAVELARRALSDERIFHDESFGFLAHAVTALTWADELDLAESALNRSIDAARGWGSSLLVMAALCLRADVALRRGRLLAAEADARAALGLLEAGASPATPCAIALLADALLEGAGAVAACAALEAVGDDAAIPQLRRASALLATRGRVRIATGRHAEGVADLRECGRRLAAGGSDNPAVIAWRSAAAPALAALGRLDEARRLADEEVALARRFGASRALGVALRAAALVEGGADGVDLLRVAVDVLDRAGAELELARALTDLGAAVRRAGARHDARELLRRGLEAAESAGAGPLAARARDELVAPGARPRRPVATDPGARTPSEQRLAASAREGETDRGRAHDQGKT